MRKKAKAKRTVRTAPNWIAYRPLPLPFPFNEPQPAPKPPAPSFGLGTVITGASLVTDRSGVAWWVDPQARIIRRV